ncbi:hypothetical protein E2986_02260 [Frieseomelitta varia]|uniref:Uncharacterized protein n=1 Tax=Frieseomelitta varia TaxID=561572 RepID=A0A833RSL9_9HYME|nr:hypothetical protein E2986_02260 [Frieseomelitta varia]
MWNMSAIKFFLAVISLTTVIAVELPKNWEVCSRSLPEEEFSKCLDKAARDAVVSLAGGENFSVPTIFPVEPLLVDNVKIGGSQGSVSLKQEYKNIKLYGLTKDLEIHNHHLELDNGCLLTSDSFNPQVDFVADYKLDGKVLLLPVRGSGKSNITMCKYICLYYSLIPYINFKFNMLFLIITEICVYIRQLLLFEYLDGLKSHNELACEKYKKNGETYLKIKKYSVTFRPDKVKLNFDNLFNGDKVIGTQLNTFMNENADLLFKELQGPYEETFSQVFTKLSNEVFSRVPMNKIFPPK